MRDKFIRFMYGRYGIDEYSKTVLYSAVAVSVLGLIFKMFKLEIVSLAFSTVSSILIIYIIYRTFSRNINRRVMENHKFLAKTEKLRTRIKFFKTRFRERKAYKYVKCPNCKSYSRVPKGKGKIKITCRVCKKQFSKKV